MDSTLQEFYNEINEWISKGCPYSVVFATNGGLCRNLSQYLKYNNALAKSPVLAMPEQFLDAGLEFLMPFNESPEDYRDECNNNTVFLNPKRIKWVKDHANR